MTPAAMLWYSALAGILAVLAVCSLAVAARRADRRREAARWPTPSQLQDAGYKFRGR